MHTYQTNATNVSEKKNTVQVEAKKKQRRRRRRRRRRDVHPLASSTNGLGLAGCSDVRRRNNQQTITNHRCTKGGKGPI